MSISGIYISNLTKSVYDYTTDFILGITQNPQSITEYKPIKGILNYSPSSSYSYIADYTEKLVSYDQDVNTYDSVKFSTVDISNGYFYFNPSSKFPLLDGSPNQVLSLQDINGTLGWSDQNKIIEDFSSSSIFIKVLTGKTISGSSVILTMDGSSELTILQNQIWACNANVHMLDSNGNSTSTFLHFVAKNDGANVGIVNGVKTDDQIVESGTSGTYKIYTHSSIGADTYSSSINIMRVNPTTLRMSVNNPSETSYTNWKVVVKILQVSCPIIPLTPPLTGLPVLPTVAVGYQDDSAILTNNEYWGWGENGGGQLGFTTPNGYVPHDSGIGSLVYISIGLGHSLAIDQTGSLWGWGSNSHSELQSGSNPSLPIKLSTPLNVIHAAAGYFNSFAVKSDGTVWGWGLNITGIMGDTNVPDRSTPTQISGLSGIVAISIGYGLDVSSHGLALKSDGTVWSWGCNQYGELGNGSTSGYYIPITTPYQVPLTDVVQVVAGSDHFSMALKSDGTVWVWGENNLNQLGDGTIVDKYSPIQVSGLTGITMISACAGTGYAVKSDGTVWSWGYNNNCECGISPSGGTISTPTQISILSGIVTVAGGGGSLALAMRSDASTWGWGRGAVGDGNWYYATTPVQCLNL